MSHVLVKNDSPIRSVEELKGKRIGTDTGATQLLTLRLFEKQYLKWDPEQDVQMLQVAPPLQVQALETGQYDALFTIEPFASAALAKGIARDILPYARGKILDPFPAGASSVRPDVLLQKRELVWKLYEGMVRGADFIDRHPDEARRILAKWASSDEASAELVGGYEYHSFADFNIASPERVQQLADLFYDGQILQSKIDAQAMFLDEKDLK